MILIKRKIFAFLYNHVSSSCQMPNICKFASISFIKTYFIAWLKYDLFWILYLSSADSNIKLKVNFFSVLIMLIYPDLEINRFTEERRSIYLVVFCFFDKKWVKLPLRKDLTKNQCKLMTFYIFAGTLLYKIFCGSDILIWNRSVEWIVFFLNPTPFFE